MVEKNALSLACVCLFLGSSPMEVAAFARAPLVIGNQELRFSARCPMTAQVQASTSRERILQEMSAAVAGVAVGTGLRPVQTQAVATTLPPAKVEVATNEDVDRRQVLAATMRWRDTVTAGGPEAPKKTASLYAPDGVLWGTVSEEVRDTPEEIYDYFDYFARLPKLRLTEYTPVAVRVFGDFAIHSGSYTFAWQGKDGETKEKRARFSFTFRRDSSSPTDWTIVEHHSSAMPTSPAELKRASR